MFDFVNKLKDKGRWRIFKLKLICLLYTSDAADE